MSKANCDNLIRSDNFQPASMELDINAHGVVYLDTQMFLDDYWTMGLSKYFSCKGGRWLWPEHIHRFQVPKKGISDQF